LSRAICAASFATSQTASATDYTQYAQEYQEACLDRESSEYAVASIAVIHLVSKELMDKDPVDGRKAAFFHSKFTKISLLLAATSRYGRAYFPTDSISNYAVTQPQTDPQGTVANSQISFGYSPLSSSEHLFRSNSARRARGIDRIKPCQSQYLRIFRELAGYLQMYSLLLIQSGIRVEHVHSTTPP